MKTYLLIGGIGSGKSTVGHMLAEHGADVVDLDTIGHVCLADAAVIAALRDAFGPSILTNEGTIDRRALAHCAFVDADTTRTLNDITHPAIVSSIQETLAAWEQDGCDCAVVEVSAYAGPGTSLDVLTDQSAGIIAVVAPEQMRLQRAVEAGMSEDDVRARMQLQPTDDQRRLWADYVIVNDGSLSRLQAQVDALWAAIAPMK